jgi:hypothetical protein
MQTKWLQAVNSARPVVGAVLVDEVFKVLEGHHCEQLCEYRAASMHVNLDKKRPQYAAQTHRV